MSGRKAATGVFHDSLFRGGLVESEEKARLKIRDRLVVDENSIEENRYRLVEFVAAVFEEFSSHTVDSLCSIIAETGSSSRDFRACNRRVKSAGLAAPFREWDGIGALEKIRVVVGDGHQLEIGTPQLIALPVIKDETLGLFFFRTLVNSKAALSLLLVSISAATLSM